MLKDFTAESYRYVSDCKSVVANLRRILRTSRGEVVGNPSLGLDLEQFLELGEDELGGIEFYIKTAVEKQEPRLLVTKVSHLLENNELKIRVDFEVPEFEMKDSLSMGVSKNAG